MEDIGNAYLTEDDTDLSSKILLEDGTTLLMENAPDINFNNYEFVRAEDGISVTEKIR